MDLMIVSQTGPAPLKSGRPPHIVQGLENIHVLQIQHRIKAVND